MLIGRFAPTPSGPLHLGSLYCAVASYLDVKSRGGRWLLRIEDVDRQRSRAAHIDQIKRTFTALGLHWDGEVRRQSEHLEDYAAALARLRGHCYCCDCSRRDWQPAAALGPLGPVYPGCCRGRGKSTGARRLALADRTVSFTDRLLGPSAFALSALGDPILQRRDGDYAYLLAVVVDDQLQGVNTVLRGQDLYPATALQIYLQELLGYHRPEYLHLPLLLDGRGQKLSKSKAAPPLDAAALTQQLVECLRLLGQPVALAPPPLMLQEALAHWNPANLPRQPLVIS